MHNHANIAKALEYNNAVSADLLQIFEPLSKNFGISTFAYTKIFEDKIFKISSNNEWFKFHITNEFYEQNHYRNDTLQFGTDDIYIKFWNDASSDLVQAMYRHDLWHGISIYKKFKDYIEMWSFAADKDNYNIVDFYMNNISFLKRFIIYFQNKAGRLIDASDNSRLIQKKNKLILDSNNNFDRNQLFLKETTLSKIKNDNQVAVNISKRELECMYLLSLGKSPKEIGAILNISYRTVETYIHQLKYKLGYHFKSELIANFRKNLMDYYKPEIHI